MKRFSAKQQKVLEELEKTSKDFWNIAGRAGRAFVDIEGKILYAVDENHWSYRRDIQLCRDYFDITNMDKATSGLLSLIKEIKNIATQCNINKLF